MLGIGLYFYRGNTNTQDYFLGGRNIGPAVSALSAGASDMSGWLLLGLPGALYVSGFSSSYIAIGLSIGALLNWSFVAKRLRIYTGLANNITIADYFESRFNDKQHILRLIYAVVVLIFFTVYVSSGLVAGGKLFESVFNVKYIYALTTGTSIIIVYTFLGGYNAVCWTDTIQGVLMMLALIVVPFAMLNAIGGYDETINILKEIKPEALSMGIHGGGKEIGLLSIISALAWGLGYFGQPHIIIRFMSIRRTQDIPLATFIGISWMVISLIGACLIGVFGVVYVHKFNLTLNDPERIFIMMSQILFNPWVAGILLSAILAAIMSTASSQLLVSSSTIAEDFYKKVFRKDAEEKTVMRLGRIGVLAVALVAFYLSTDRESSVLRIVAYAWGGFGASFGTVIIFSLFYKRMTRAGAIAGMVTGASVVILYERLFYKFLPVYELLPGFILASLAIVIVSLMTTKQDNKHFEQMLKEA